MIAYTIMRAVVQRVTSASVTGKQSKLIDGTTPHMRQVNGKVISSISRGLMVLVGIGTGAHTPATMTPLNLLQDRRHPRGCRCPL